MATLLRAKANLLVIICIASFLMVSCSAEQLKMSSDNLSTPEDFIELGKSALENNDWSTALWAFNEVLEKLDPNNNQAKLGYVLADLEYLIFFIKEIYNQMAEVNSSDFSISTLIQELVKNGFLPLNEKDQTLLWDIITSNDTNFSFKVNFPIKFKEDVKISWDGEFDINDVHLVYALLHVIHGIEEFATGLNLEIEPKALRVEVVANEPIWSSINEFLKNLVSEKVTEDFLKIQDSKKVKNFAIDLAKGIREIAIMLDGVASTSKDRSNNIVKYDGKVLSIGSPDIKRFLTPEALRSVAYIFNKLADSLLDGTSYDRTPNENNAFDLAFINPFIKAVVSSFTDKDNYENFWQWYLVQTASNYLDEYIEFVPGCLTWNVGEELKKDNPDPNIIRDVIQSIVDSQVFEVLASLDKQSGTNPNGLSEEDFNSMATLGLNFISKLQACNVASQENLTE